ncbi:hypothetical protein C8J57DRAFT_1240238 [Mycena rebaudengoi]|nr:hypothetical protein C8J57DRAFT_1240238 [Mycena rebaudengoi]
MPDAKKRAADATRDEEAGTTSPPAKRKTRARKTQHAYQNIKQPAAPPHHIQSTPRGAEHNPQYGGKGGGVHPVTVLDGAFARYIRMEFSAQDRGAPSLARITAGWIRSQRRWSCEER